MPICRSHHTFHQRKFSGCFVEEQVHGMHEFSGSAHLGGGGRGTLQSAEYTQRINKHTLVTFSADAGEQSGSRSQSKSLSNHVRGSVSSALATKNCNDWGRCLAGKVVCFFRFSTKNAKSMKACDCQSSFSGINFYLPPRYRFVKLLGSGGFGHVWYAVHFCKLSLAFL